MSNIIFTESSGVADSIYGKSQAPIRMFIEKKGESFENESMLSKLFSMQRSNHFAEKYTSLSAMSNFQPVGENGGYPESSMREGFSKTLENETWKSSFAISREMIEDAKIIDLRRRPLAFTAAYYRTREDFGARLYGAAINGETEFTLGTETFSAACAETDNGAPVALFGRHKNLITGTEQENRFSLSFSAENLSRVETAMQNTKGENDELLDICPDTIVIPNDGALKRKVFEVIGADKSPDTSNNGFNYQYGRWKIAVSPYFNRYIGQDVVNPWILIDSRYMNDYCAAVFQDRVPLQVRSSLDDSNDSNIWRGYARFAAGFNDWRFASLSCECSS